MNSNELTLSAEKEKIKISEDNQKGNAMKNESIIPYSKIDERVKIYFENPLQLINDLHNSSIPAEYSKFMLQAAKKISEEKTSGSSFAENKQLILPLLKYFELISGPMDEKKYYSARSLLSQLVTVALWPRIAADHLARSKVDGFIKNVINLWSTFALSQRGRPVPVPVIAESEKFKLKIVAATGVITEIANMIAVGIFSLTAAHVAKERGIKDLNPSPKNNRPDDSSPGPHC